MLHYLQERFNEQEFYLAIDFTSKKNKMIVVSFLSMLL